MASSKIHAMTSISRRLFIVLSLVCLGCAGAPQKTVQDAELQGAPATTGDLSRIGHIILAVNDLQKGMEEFERRTGVRPAYGGAHTGRGTHNALVSLGEPHYLEILAPNPEDKVNADWLNELRSLTSLTPFGWSARGENLEALQQSLKQQGIEIGEVHPGARTRPDGTRLAWKALDFAQSHPLLPFFMEWDPATTAHPSKTSPGGCRLAGFTLQDPAPDALRKPLQAAGLQLDIREGKEPLIRISLACPKGNVELP